MLSTRASRRHAASAGQLRTRPSPDVGNDHRKDRPLAQQDRQRKRRGPGSRTPPARLKSTSLRWAFKPGASNLSGKCHRPNGSRPKNRLCGVTQSGLLPMTFLARSTVDVHASADGRISVRPVAGASSAALGASVPPIGYLSSSQPRRSRFAFAASKSDRKCRCDPTIRVNSPSANCRRTPQTITETRGKP